MKVLFYDSNATACREVNKNNTFVLEFSKSYSQKELTDFAIEAIDESLRTPEEFVEYLKEKQVEAKLIQSGWSANDEAVEESIDMYF